MSQQLKNSLARLDSAVANLEHAVQAKAKSMKTPRKGTGDDLPQHELFDVFSGTPRSAGVGAGAADVLEMVSDPAAFAARIDSAIEKVETLLREGAHG